MKKDNLLVYALGVLIVVGAYMLGVYKTRYEMLTKGGGESQQAQQQGGQQQPSQEQPKEKTVLSDKEWQEILQNPVAVKGDKEAQVTMVEFLDYQCPFCRRYFEDTYGQIVKDYVEKGKVKYVARDFPLSFHRNAMGAAVAARCAGEKGKYWEMHDKLYENQNEWAELSNDKAKEAFNKYAQTIGVDISKCQDDNKIMEAVKADVALGQKIGVSGTPTFFVNGKVLVGAQPYSSFKTMIEEALKQ